MATERKNNLTRARERAGLTQEQLAELLNVSQSQISKWEANPEEFVTPKIAKEWANATGCSPRDLLFIDEADREEAPSADFGDPYKIMNSNIRLLFEYIAAAPAQLAIADTDPPLARNIRLVMHKFSRKPVIAATGVFDAGKSTLLNVLMGKNVLPTSYQPATRLPTYILHDDHKPTWMRDGETVLIVSDVGVDALYEEDSTKLRESVIVALGNTQTLEEFGTHNGAYAENTTARAVVVFENAPILRACSFLDLPGYDDSDADGRTADLAIGRADALLYLSPANGFLRASDFRRLAHILPTLPYFERCDAGFAPLGNLFIVASHANRQISDRELEEIFRRASDRCWRDLGEGTLPKLSDRTGRRIDAAVIRSRMFPFFRELPERKVQLQNALQDFLCKSMPKIWRELATIRVEAFKKEGKQHFRKLIENWQESLRRMDEMHSMLKRMEEQEFERKRSFKESQERLLTKIAEYSTVMRDKFSSYIDSRLTVNVLTKEITDRYKSKKDAMESVGNYVIDTVQATLNQMCHEYGEFISNDLERELRDVLPESLGSFGKLGPFGTFDIKGTFIGGIAGLSTVGALSIWAATCGPLGGYIIVAQAVGWLSALGIPFGSGGAATVISFVSAIGGPIVLALGLALVVSLLAWAIFADSWQVNLAKKLIKVFAEKNAKQTWLQFIDDFWAQTHDGVVKGYEVLEKKWQTNLDELRKIVSDPDESRIAIEQKIHRFEGIADFFAGLPWRPEP